MKTTEMVMKFLKEQGFCPVVDEDNGNIIFKYQMSTFIFFNNDEDEEFFQLAFPGIYDVDEDNRELVLEAADKVNDKVNEAANKVNEKRAFNIGLYQCISVIPGVSRSMATIVGGMTQGLTRQRAAEFSFFLAVPTMAGATLLDLLDLLKEDTAWATSHNITMLILGCVVAFIVALLAMKWFVAFLTKYGFKAFGYYRIIVGGIILVLLLTGHSLAMVD